jgi:hypothetical protein
MDRTFDEAYSDLLRPLASPTVVEPAVLAEYIRDVERMHSMGHITDWQLRRAKKAYAATLKRDPRQGGPRSPETRADERA